MAARRLNTQPIIKTRKAENLHAFQSFTSNCVAKIFHLFQKQVEISSFLGVAEYYKFRTCMMVPIMEWFRWQLKLVVYGNYLSYQRLCAQVWEKAQYLCYRAGKYTQELEGQQCLIESKRLLSRSWPWKFVFLHRNQQQRDFIKISVMTAAMLVVSFCEALPFWTIPCFLVPKVLLNSGYLRSCSAFCMNCAIPRGEELADISTPYVLLLLIH